jgi:DNA-binding HxlR family transcriptional regulator
MTTPKPARPARGRVTDRAFASLLDLLGRRWALRIVWELRAGSLHSRALGTRCGATPSVLHRRLRELREARMVDWQHGHGYGLSPHGCEVIKTLEPLQVWAPRWERAATR